ncbi:MAG: hypothetical protein ACW99J_15510 [Candidatus Thorarchaeota archaeon]|jgi:hypothetical protein
MQGYDPLGLLIAAGRIHSWTSDIKFGSNPAVGQAWELVHTLGGSPLINDTAGTVEIVSTDTDDDSGGDGANTIEFSGVDADFVQQKETITMDGTTAASSVGSFLYVYRAKVLTAGSVLRQNAGNINLSLGGSNMCQIPGGSGQSETLYRPVPASGVMYLSGLGVAVAKGSDVDVRILEYDQVGKVWRVKLDTHSYQNTNSLRFLPPYQFTEKHLICVVAKTTNASGFEVSGWFDYIISQGDT